MADLPNGPFLIVHINLWKKPEMTGDSLWHLEGLTALEGLGLTANPKIGPAGAKHIASLKGLEYLELDGAQLTDAGLEKLENLNDLTERHLHGTRVSGDGVARLKAALPECRIHWDEKGP